jgi:hypothetical protein
VDRNQRSGDPSDAPHRVEAQEGKKGRRRGGNRGRKSVTREIQRTAQKRQTAWLDGEPRLRAPEFDHDLIPYRRETAMLTAQLDDLYDEHRNDQAGTR